MTERYDTLKRLKAEDREKINVLITRLLCGYGSEDPLWHTVDWLGDLIEENERLERTVKNAIEGSNYHAGDAMKAEARISVLEGLLRETIGHIMYSSQHPARKHEADNLMDRIDTALKETNNAG